MTWELPYPALLLLLDTLPPLDDIQPRWKCGEEEDGLPATPGMIRQFGFDFIPSPDRETKLPGVMQSTLKMFDQFR